jgi:hypothetical protein
MAILQLLPLNGGKISFRSFTAISQVNTTANGSTVGVKWDLLSGQLDFAQFNIYNQGITIGGTTSLSPGGHGGTGQSWAYLATAGNSLDFSDNSTLQIDIGGTTQGTTAWTPDVVGSYDYVRVQQAANLDGDLDIHLVQGFASSITGANSFTILTASTLNSTTFDNTLGGKITTAGGGVFDITYNANSVVLSNYIPAPQGTIVTIR